MAAKKTTAKKTTAKKAPATRRPARVVKPPDRSAATAIENLLGTLSLDEAGEARASIARALARKLDAAAAKDPVGGDPTAGIAKELRDVVDAILEASEDDGDFVADLFAVPS